MSSNSPRYVDAQIEDFLYVVLFHENNDSLFFLSKSGELTKKFCVF